MRSRSMRRLAARATRGLAGATRGLAGAARGIAGATRSLAGALALAAAVLPACAGAGNDGDDDAPDSAATQPAMMQDSAALAGAARQIVSFLRGQGALDPALLADSVTLQLAPEGGGASRRLSREQLADRASWSVGDYAFAPPASLTNLTLQPGTHFSCFEIALAARDEALARLPHVGTRLEMAEGGNCLQTWNLTLVFAAESGPPQLVAALYDQFEW